VTRPAHANRPRHLPDRELLTQLAKALDDELIAIRRDIHAHPELGRAEVRTTRTVRERLVAAGLTPRVLPTGTGLVCDIGEGETAVALRADLDALPVTDVKDVPYRSKVDGVCHACGHDVHTTVMLGAALVLKELHDEGRLPGRVRLVFQPAEELTPGGSLDTIASGALEGVRSIMTVHCEPRAPVGMVGVRTGAITSAADRLQVRLAGPGGHTARPHLTADLVHALGTLVTQLPTALSRRVDPRAGMTVVWGRVSSGIAHNAIPQTGEVEGTLRCLDANAWHSAPEVVSELVSAIVAPYGVRAELDYQRGVPPVVNDAEVAETLAAAVRSTEGEDALFLAEQSLGGEDFAWYLDSVPGALARLGVGRRDPEARMAPSDLHQGSFDIDEDAIGVGVRVISAAALLSFS
jgi:amidohydrolase